MHLRGVLPHVYTPTPTTLLASAFGLPRIYTPNPSAAAPAPAPAPSPSPVPSPALNNNNNNKVTEFPSRASPIAPPPSTIDAQFLQSDEFATMGPPPPLPSPFPSSLPPEEDGMERKRVVEKSKVSSSVDSHADDDEPDAPESDSVSGQAWDRKYIEPVVLHPFDIRLSMEDLNKQFVLTCPPSGVPREIMCRYRTQGMGEYLFMEWLISLSLTCLTQGVDIGLIAVPDRTVPLCNIMDPLLATGGFFEFFSSHYTDHLVGVSSAIQFAKKTMAQNKEKIFGGMFLDDFIIGRMGYDYWIGIHAPLERCTRFAQSKMRTMFFRLVAADILSHASTPLQPEKQLSVEKQVLIDVIVNTMPGEVQLFW
jgi:hypothetical protein